MAKNRVWKRWEDMNWGGDVIKDLKMKTEL